MNRAFPNQLNQEKVIKLANSVVPDLSIIFESDQYSEQFGNQKQFMYNQNMEYVYQQYENYINQPMLPPRYIACPRYYWVGYQCY